MGFDNIRGRTVAGYHPHIPAFIIGSHLDPLHPRFDISNTGGRTALDWSAKPAVLETI